MIIRNFLACLLVVGTVLTEGGRALAAPLSFQVLPTSNPAAPSGMLADVGPGGIDGGFRTEAGTVTVASLKAARDAIRAATGRTAVGQTAVPSNWDGATVTLLAGTHFLSETFTLDSRDSGTAAKPVVYRAAEGSRVVVSGAFPVADNSWSLVTSADTYPWSRIDAAYRAEVYKLNVGALGIDTGSMSGGNGTSLNMLMLLVGDNLRLMSRWPAGADTESAAFTPITAATGGSSGGAAATVTVGSSMPAGWDEASQDILAYGIWNVAWGVYWERITAINPSGGSSVLSFTRTGDYSPQPNLMPDGEGRFIALRNQLNVIGRGEYSWNRTNGMLYYRPLDGEGSPVNTSLTLLPNVMTLGVDENAAQACNYVEFDGLVFEGSRQNTVQAFKSTGLTFTNCEVRNSGHSGWNVEDATNFTISGGSTHDTTVRGGYIHGGNKATLTNANIVVQNYVVDDIGCYLQGLVTAALQFTDAGGNASCGVLVDGVTISNVRDAAIGISGPNTTIRNCTIDRANMLTGDAGALTITGGEYSFTNINVLIEDNTFSNIIRHPRHHQSFGALFTIYDESNAYWTIQDNIFTNCDQAINVACGKNQTIRRNKFTNCHLGHYGAPVKFGNRVGYAHNATAIPADLTAMAVQNEPYLSAAPRLTAFRTGQPENVVVLYHDDIICVDNWSNAGTRIFSQGAPGSTWATVSGYQVGVDPTQLNYPIGASLAGSGGLPVVGGGTLPLSDLD